MSKTIVYWYLNAKMYMYLFLNYKKFKKAKEEKNVEAFNKYLTKSYKLYSDTIFKSSKSDLIIEGTDKINLDDTYLVTSNHLGIADIAAIVKAFPKIINFVGKKEISGIPIFSDWMRISGCVFMDRSNVRESISQVNEGIKVLKSGMSMCVYPEGTRSVTGEIGEFKKGSFRLAIKSGAKILPTVLVGTRSVYEDNKNRIKKGKIRVVFLDPIDIKDLSDEELNNIHNIVRDRIEKVYKSLK